MEFKKYCVIMLGDVSGCKTQIEKVSDIEKPRYMEATGLVISTFSSVLLVKELTSYFKSFKRNFVVFELNLDNSGFNLTDKNIQKLIFDEMLDKKNGSESKTDSLFDSLLNKEEFEETVNKFTSLQDQIKSSLTDNGFETPEIDMKVETKRVKAKVWYHIREDMGTSEIERIIDEILDKGDSITEYEKGILSKLSEKI
tara:strand:+ start:2219 stop:2812 length:594 start_codon:yes stop_codon:yes gene_type:complete